MIFRVNKACPQKEHAHATLYKITSENNAFYLDTYGADFSPRNFRSRMEFGDVKQNGLVLKMLKTKREKIGDDKNYYIIFIPLEGQYESIMHLEKIL